MKTLNVTRYCSLVKLSDVEHPGASLGEQLEACVKSGPSLILDVDGVQFTSMMLGELVNVLSALKEQWGDRTVSMVMIRPTTLARQVMRVSKLDQAIPVFDDLESAWRGLRSKA